MGMYTELVLKCSVKHDAPQSVIKILNSMFNYGEDPDELPDDEFFNTPRWNLIGRCSSYYHHPNAVNSFTEGYLFSRSDIKNYDDEIQKFLKWVAPYLDDGCIGWVWYEEYEWPTLVAVQDGKVVYKEVE